MDTFANVIGILGAYFALLLVLAVAVETILDPFTFLKGLQKKIDPDDLIKDLQDWLPKGSKVEAQSGAVSELGKNIKDTEVDIQAKAKEAAETGEAIAKSLGIDAELAGIYKQLASQVYALRAKYRLDEQKRIIILRVLSAIIGVVIALILQIDTFQILSGLFSPDALEVLTSSFAHYGGMVLTGLAASAGSSFWHDQLGKVRALKEVTQSGTQNPQGSS